MENKSCGSSLYVSSGDGSAELQRFFGQIFDVSSDIRYVSILSGGQLSTAQRAAVSGASASESDRYEELFVNPALLNLTMSRGNLDCGGLSWLVVRYGNFQQFVRPIKDGHLSVCFELSARPEEHAERFGRLLTQYHLDVSLEHVAKSGRMSHD